MAGSASKQILLSLIGKDVSAGTALKGVGAEAEKTEAKVSGLNKGFDTAMAISGGAAVGFAAKTVSGFMDVGSETLKLQRYMGGTAEDASRLRFAAQQTGTDIDGLGKAMGIASKNIESGKDKFAQFGIATKDADGKTRSMNDILMDTADKFEKMPNGAEKTAMALQLFGRAGADMIPMLNRGSDGLKALEAETDKYGLVLSKDNLDAVKKAKEAQRELTAEWQGVEVQIGSRVLPAVSGLTGALANLPKPLLDIAVPLATVGAGLAGLAVVGGKIVTGLKPAIDGFQKFQSKLSDSESTVGKLADKVGGASQAIGAGAIAVGGAIAVYEIWNARMQEAYQHAAQLGDLVTQGNLKRGFDQMPQQISAINDQISGLSDEIANSHAPWDADYRAEMESYQTQLIKSRDALQKEHDMIGDVSAATGASADTIKKWMDQAGQQGITFDNTAAAIAAYTGNVDDNTLSEKEAADATKAHDQAVKDLNDTLTASWNPIFAMSQALEANKQAEKDAADAVKQHGINSDEAAKANMNVAKTSVDLQVASNNLNNEIQKGNISLDQQKQMLDQFVKSGSMTRAEADRLTWSVAGLGNTAQNYAKTYTGTFDANTAPAEQKLGRLAGFLNNITQMFFQVNGNYSPNQTIPGHASGGTLDAGWNLVGEQGPELVNSQSGQVLTAGQTRSALGGGGGPTVVINMGIVGDPREAGRQAAEALRQYYNAPGARPLPSAAVA